MTEEKSRHIDLSPSTGGDGGGQHQKHCLWLVVLTTVLAVSGSTQVVWSVGTDFSVLRNESRHQKFWSVGQTVQANAHFTRKEAAYAWLTYYSTSAFHNSFTAGAKSPLTIPQSINYEVKGHWRYRQVSLGWKHYFKGSYDTDSSWNLYGLAGFGLLFVKASNDFSAFPDTVAYHSTGPRQIAGEFKRLTWDLGLGAEVPVGADVFLYTDLRTWIQASDYPSPLLHSNDKVPLPIIGSIGLRILFQ